MYVCMYVYEVKRESIEENIGRTHDYSMYV